MADDPDEQVARIAATLTRGSIVAAAGCGKTEQIARAVAFSSPRRLILTHTHAGVDAISRRLERFRIPEESYRIDTIAAWSLRFASSFPGRSGLVSGNPNSQPEWSQVYTSAAQLLNSGAVDGIIKASYGGLFVDEYQDCDEQQHQVLSLLADRLPTCVFGDHLQAIFDFRGHHSVDWPTHVYPFFPKVHELTTPWRWLNKGNEALANWLKIIRPSLEETGTIDFSSRPACVKWSHLPPDTRHHQNTFINVCLEAKRRAADGNLIVIGDSANVNSRTCLAKALAKYGFSNVEPVSCKDLYASASKIDNATGFTRFQAVIEFASKCMTGTEKAALEHAVCSRMAGRKSGAKFGCLIPIAMAIAASDADEPILEFLETIRSRPETHLYRREMFFSLRAAIQIKITQQHDTISSAVWVMQNRLRHLGRRISKCSIGSTLLVKGLEFDHSVILHFAKMTRKDLYVALTRASDSIHIVSPTLRLVLP